MIMEDNEHIVINEGPGFGLFCKCCEMSYLTSMPITVNEMVDLVQHFKKHHSNCKTKVKVEIIEQ